MIVFLLDIAHFIIDFAIIYIKDRIANPAPSGYRDMIALFKDPDNSIIGEIQFHLCHILKVKDEEHKLYEIAQGIERKANFERRKLSHEEQQQLQQIRNSGKKIYSAALEQAELGITCKL